MKKELDHFYIGNSYGGNQDWFDSFLMRVGGCGAETACDISICLARQYGLTGLYPFDAGRLTRRDYVRFGNIMKPYLRPRMRGINRISIFIDGYSKYLTDRGEDRVALDGLQGTASYEEAAAAIRGSIDSGVPVACLILNHRNRRFSDYVWHWFILNGYDERRYAPDSSSAAAGIEDTLFVKAVTYSEYEWLDLRGLWDTGCDEKGGLVLPRLRA
jgi:hypothetical protein